MKTLAAKVILGVAALALIVIVFAFFVDATGGVLTGALFFVSFWLVIGLVVWALNETLG